MPLWMSRSSTRSAFASSSVFDGTQSLSVAGSGTITPSRSRDSSLVSSSMSASNVEAMVSTSAIAPRVVS